MAIRTKRCSLRLVSTALFVAVLWHRGAEAAEFKVCIDKSSPAAQMDAGVAKAVGRLQGATADIIWFDGSADDDGLSPAEFRRLARGSCALILGFPVDAQAAALPDGVRATQPYASTGFVLVTRKHGATSLDRLPAGSTVAVTYMTAPNLYFADHRGIAPDVFTSDAEALRALQRRQVDAAILWRPYVAHHLHDKTGELSITAVAEAHAAWNLVALYDEAASPVAAQFEQSIDQLRSSGALQKLLQPYADAAVATHVALAAGRRNPQPLSMTARLIAVSSKKHSSAASAKAPPALFTEEQAQAGKLAYQTNCAVCHGPHLEGRAGPALKGVSFATPEAHFSVSDVFEILSKNMPAPAPGSLPQDDYVSIMSFLLEQNGYPAGSSPLSFEIASKSKVKLIYREVHSD